MKEPGLDDRHHDKDGEISRKHGNTLVKTLRKIYGHGFAIGLPTPTSCPTFCRRHLLISR